MSKILGFSWFSRILCSLVLAIFWSCGGTENEKQKPMVKSFLEVSGSKHLMEAPSSVEALSMNSNDNNEENLNEVFAQTSPGDGQIQIDYIYFTNFLITDIRIFRKAGGSVPSLNEITDVNGNDIPGDNVEEVYFGPANSGSFIDNNVINGTSYTYRIWTYSAILDCYSSNGTSVSAIPLALYSMPFPEVSNLIFEAGDEKITIGFDFPEDLRAIYAWILRKTTDDIEGPWDLSATRVQMDGGTANGFNTTMDTDLTNGTTYYYKIFAMGLGGQHSLGVTGSATPEEFCEATPIFNFHVSPGDEQNTLSWEQPSDIEGVWIVRNTTPPIDPNDGTILNLTGSPFSDTGLNNGTTYYYAAYSYCGNDFSNSVVQSATPNEPVFGSNHVEYFVDYLKAETAGAYDNFGSAIDVEGSTAVIGAPDADRQDSGPLHKYGAAYVFEKQNDGSWIQTEYLRPYYGNGPLNYCANPEDTYGASVAIDGDTIAIGSPKKNNCDIPSQFPDEGGVYIYQRSSDGYWILSQLLTAATPGLFANFGSSVEIVGNTLFVGARRQEVIQDESNGAVYVFQKQSDGTWLEIDILTASNAGHLDEFGKTLAADENTLAVSAPNEDGNDSDSQLDSGAVYLFEKQPNGQWVETAYLKGSNLRAGDNFGASTSVYGNLVAVGSKYDDGNGTSEEVDSGAAYLFEKQPNGQWIESHYIKSYNIGKSDFFGQQVSLKENIMIISAPGERGSIFSTMGTPDDEIAHAGAVYIFEKQNSEWVQTRYVKSPHYHNPGEYFGNTLAFDGYNMFVGLPDDSGVHGSLIGFNTPWLTNSGSVYVLYVEPFVAPLPNNNFLSYLKPHNPTAYTGNSTHFFAGQSDMISIDGTRAVIGATGNNGAAYVFEQQNDGQWIETAYLHTNSAGVAVGLGSSVAIDGSRIAVGAIADNTAAENAGAVYIFEQQADSSWQQVSVITASNATSLDRFGSSVKLDGDTIIIGAEKQGTGNDQTGAVYVFQRQNNGQWIESAFLRGSSVANGDDFGRTVDYRPGIIIVGAPNDDEIAISSGAVYVFEQQNNGEWLETAYLKTTNPQSDDSFGKTLAVQGDLIVVGHEKDNGNGTIEQYGSGAVNIFEKNFEGQWLETHYLKASDIAQGDSFGASVALKDNFLFVGVSAESGGPLSTMLSPDNNRLYSGAVLIFEKQGDQWHQIDYWKSPILERMDYFGSAIAVNGSTLIVGSLGEDGGPNSTLENPDSNASMSGAAFVFSLTNLMTPM